MSKEFNIYLENRMIFFSRPSESRFKEFFKSIIEKEKKPQKYYEINIKKLKSGKEKRTSLIIKGFPSRMTVNEVQSLLFNFTNKINFFYLPELVRKEKEYMYCFINLIDTKSVIGIYSGLMNIKKNAKQYIGLDFSKLEIEFSKNQGTKELGDKYINYY